MRAVVICCNHGHFPEALLKRRPLCLMPVGVKPLAQLIVENLVEKGVKRITLVISESADFVQGHFGNGDRWGVSIDYVLLKEFTGIKETLRRMKRGDDDPILLIPGLLITDCDPAVLEQEMTEAGRAAVFSWDEGTDESPPREMLVLAHDAVEALPPGVVRAASCCGQWQAEGLARVVPGPCTSLLVWDYASYWQANQAFLAGEPPFSAQGGLSVRMGLRRHIDTTATLIPPVIIGDEVEIGKNCKVGPRAVIGGGSILDEGAEVADSLVFPGTYLGPDTSLSEVIADRNLMVGYPGGVATHVPDFFIMGPASSMSSNLASSLIQRFLALILFLLSLPVLAMEYAAALFRPGLMRRERFAGEAALTALSGEIDLTEVSVRYFDVANPVLRFIPALLDVLRGEIGLVGVELVSPETAREMIGGWAEPRLFCRPGLIGPWIGQGVTDPDEMERRVMEIYYAATKSFSEDVKILWSAASLRFNGK